MATAGLLALNHRGWRAVDIGEGSIHSYERVLGPELRAELHFGPGYAREEPKAEPVQALGKLELRLRDDMGRAVRVPYTRLDAVLASELLRDVELLIPARH